MQSALWLAFNVLNQYEIELKSCMHEGSIASMNGVKGIKHVKLADATS